MKQGMLAILASDRVERRGIGRAPELVIGRAQFLGALGIVADAARVAVEIARQGFVFPAETLAADPYCRRPDAPSRDAPCGLAEDLAQIGAAEPMAISLMMA